MTGFNDSLWIAGESLAISLSTVCAVEYDSDGEKVQYGPNDCALPKARPPTLQGMLAHLELSLIRVPVRSVMIPLISRLFGQALEGGLAFFC